MAGQLTIDTLKASSGVLATQNGMTGIAKAWVNFNGTGTPAIRSSFNVSSVVRNSTGQYSINYTTAMADANYSMVASAAPVYTVAACFVTVYDNNSSNTYQATTTTGSILCRNGSSSPTDSTAIAVAIFGN